MVVTKAGQALRALLSEQMSQAELSRELGVSQPCVWFWFHYITRPEVPLRYALQRLHPQIVADDWMTDEERAIARGLR
jgi:hypothetical protein